MCVYKDCLNLGCVGLGFLSSGFDDVTANVEGFV